MIKSTKGRSSRWLQATALAGVMLLPLLGGCTSGAGAPSIRSSGLSEDEGVSINAHSVLYPEPTDEADDKLPSLAEMQSMHRGGSSSGLSAKEGLRMTTVRDVAQQYGMLGGLAAGAKQVNERLKAQADRLSIAYDFNQVVVHEGGGALVLPPVISEMDQTYQETDFGKTLRVANRSYQIMHEARFAPNSPLWYGYLIQHFTPPAPPADTSLPKNDAERKVWAEGVAEGWDDGIKLSETTFRRGMDRLTQDFQGMVRYAALLHEGKVIAPVVASTELGTTGDGQNMREGDKALKITSGARLAVPSEHSEIHRITAPARLRRARPSASAASNLPQQMTPVAPSAEAPPDDGLHVGPGSADPS